MLFEYIKIGSLLFLLVLFYQWVWHWVPYLRRRFREDCFALRDQLFFLALEGEVSFDSPVYKYLRKKINNHIRFAHRLDLLTFVLVLFYDRDGSSLESLETLKDFNNDVSKTTYEKIEKIEDDLFHKVIKYGYFTGISYPIIALASFMYLSDQSQRFMFDFQKLVSSFLYKVDMSKI